MRTIAVTHRAGPTRGLDLQILAWTLGLLSPQRRALTALVLLALAEIALRALSPWPLKVLIDRVLVTPNPALPVELPLISALTTERRHILIVIVLAGVLVHVGHQWVIMWQSRMHARTSLAVAFSLRQRLFTHLQCVALAHHTRTPAGERVYHLDADAQFFEGLVLNGLFPTVFSTLTLFVLFGVLFRLDAALALASLSVVPLLYVALQAHRRRLHPETIRLKELESRVSGHVYETLSGIRLVKSFARETYERDRYSGVAGEAMRARLALRQRESRFGLLVGAVTVAGTMLVLAIGGLHVLEGTLSIGTLLVVLTYLGFVYGPMAAIANTAGAIQNALASARRVQATLGLPTEADVPEPIEMARLGGDVRFEEVTFAYDQGRPALDRISFTARAGELIALVGPSGAGKTTLVSLIDRFYEPTAGRVLIDGVDARRYRLAGLREQVAVVLQEAILFTGTVEENIRYGRLDATTAEVVEAARAAGAHDFIRQLPEGYQTRMEKAGEVLSGGQRQRLSMARAFLKNAPVLILDEPTAALDAVSEQGIFDALKRLRAGRATFVIAHRLSTVQDADRILLLDRGRLVAEGRHADLLEQSELYRQMCEQLAVAGPAALHERRRSARRREDREST